MLIHGGFCRTCDWRDAEIYIILILDIIYAYNALMLLFGLAHCCSLVCGEFHSLYPGRYKRSLLCCKPYIAGREARECVIS